MHGHKLISGLMFARMQGVKEYVVVNIDSKQEKNSLRIRIDNHCNVQ
jgi:hypothetical protein